MLISINADDYPLTAYKVVSQAEPVTEEWRTWDQMGETVRRTGRGYNFAKGWDPTRRGVLGLSPFYHNDNNPADLTTGYGYLLEESGASGTANYDDATTATVSAASSKSFTSHTVAAQDNRVGYVTTVLASGGPTSITWDGVEMTQLVSAGSPTYSRVTVWMVKDPPTGTSTIAITFNGDVTGDISSLSFYGVDDEIPVGDIVSATGNDTTPTVTATTAAGEIVFDVAGQQVDSTGSPGANQTEKWDTGGGSNPSSCGSVQAGADGGVMSWTVTSGRWCIVAVPVKPLRNQRLVYVADATKITEYSYDSQTGLTDVSTQTIASGVAGRPVKAWGKWYVPFGSGANAYRLDSPGAGTRWVDSGFKAAHLAFWQAGLTPTMARANATTVNQIDLATSAPTADGDFSGGGWAVGDSSISITDLTVAGGELFVATELDFHQMDEEGRAHSRISELPKGRVDADNGKGMSAFHDIIFYPSQDGCHRYHINGGIRPIGVNTLKNFRDTPAVSSPKYWRHAWTMHAGSFQYILLNSDTETVLLQGRFREGDDPGGGEMVWNCILAVPLCKGGLVDSLKRLWLKGASTAEGDRDIRVIELDDGGGTEKALRKGQASADHDIWFSETDFDKAYDTKQLAKMLVETSNWATGASLQAKVYRDDGSVEDVGAAITSATLTALTWTVGTSDEARRAMVCLRLTTDGTYVPLTSDPQVLAVRGDARTPVVYEVEIDASPDALSGGSFSPEEALETLRRLVSGAKVDIENLEREGSTFSGDILSVRETLKDDGYRISVFIRRWIVP